MRSRMRPPPFSAFAACWLLLGTGLLAAPAPLPPGPASMIQFNQGKELAQRGEYEGAIACFTKFVLLNPMDPDGWYRRGLAERDKGDVKAALADFSKALKLVPKSVELHRTRGCLRLDHGDAE